MGSGLSFDEVAAAVRRYLVERGSEQVADTLLGGSILPGCAAGAAGQVGGADEMAGACPHRRRFPARLVPV